MAKKKSKSRFPLILTFMVVFVLGVGALAIVWMRMEISKVAKHCRNLEDRREIVSREVQDLRGEKSRSLRPSTLAAWFREGCPCHASQTIPCPTRMFDRRVAKGLCQ